MLEDTRTQSPKLAAEFAQLAPWVFQFRIDGADYGGAISARGDVRLEEFFRFAPDAARILELGSLEGAHTIPLAARPGVREVVAIEGRAANVAKAQLVHRHFHVQNATIMQANLEELDLTTLGRFDAVFCSGLLYHLPAPWKLITQLSQITPRLFIWTHYADDLAANEMEHGCRGQVHLEGGPNEPLSGMSASAFWPTLGSLLKLLQESGYETVEIMRNEPHHQNAPAVTLGAIRKSLPSS